jgi:hypothetical protein
MNQLFLDNSHKVSFEKIAMPVRLSESPETWQRDIAGEIYKQLPFIGDYAVNVILDRVDAQRGYGFGSAEVSNKSDAPMQDQEKLPSIRIPIIVRDYLMAPLDIFLDGKGVFPLTEERVRERLFRADTFELSTRKPTDKGLVDQLYPPTRSNYGMGMTAGDTMGLGKIASIMDEIAPTISQSDVEKFAATLKEDDWIKHAFLTNPVFHKMAYQILNTPRVSVEDTAQTLVESIRPTVVQFEKLASGNFNVKWANANAFNPQQDVVAPQAASSMAGADLSNMKPGSTVTLSTEKAQRKDLSTPVYSEVSNFGSYAVKDADTHKDYHGYVIPIIDMEMHPLDLYLFIEPTQEPKVGGLNQAATVVWSVQDDIAGMSSGGEPERAAEELGGTQPQGSGIFFSSVGKCCLPPMTIGNMAPGQSGPTIQAQDVFGENIVLHMTPGLQTIEALGNNEYSIPAELSWLELPGKPVHLAKASDEVENVDAAKTIPGQVSVGSTGPDEFSLQGMPLSKVAAADRLFIKRAEAEFLLVAMGVDPFEAKSVLKHANEKRTIDVQCNEITPLGWLHKEATKTASIALSKFPYHLKKDLVKEATVIDDADTADKVLSMNFINPENISTFAKYLPELDQAAKKLAELLLAARLGMGTVDEGAIERSMKGLEQVIDGLKQLQQNAIDENS